jgi:genome maintenance exonuclease 1
LNGTRLYEVTEGVFYPSVTTVLSEYNRSAIEDWRKAVGEEVANEISSRAARRGTRTHSFIEKYLRNSPVPLADPFIKEFFDNFIPILNDINHIHLQETALYSHHLRMAGTVDCIAEHQGRLSVIDFKTSNKLKEKSMIANYFMQCAAYAIMYEELTSVPINKLVVMIAVDDEKPQVFIEKRDNFVKELLKYRDIYEKTH